MSLIEGLNAESIDSLDIIFGLERTFKVKIPRGKIVEDARGDLPEAVFEEKGYLTDAGLKQLRKFLSEVPADRFHSPMRAADIPRLFTPETFCKLVARGLRARARAPPTRCPIASAPSRSWIGSRRSRPGIRARARFAIPADPPRVPDPSGSRGRRTARLRGWPWPTPGSSGVPWRRCPGRRASSRRRRRARSLELGVEIERCDPDAVAYGGWARVADTHILELGRCVGPMLPLEDFDAPEAVRGDFETLCGPGARPGRFPGITAPDLSLIDHVPGRRLRAALRVPETAPFFGDHFPRRPVFPASLLLDAQIRLALQLAAEALPPGQRLRPARVADVKLRSFILPGHAVEIEVGLRSATNAAAELSLTAIVEGQRVATGRIEIVSREPA